MPRKGVVIKNPGILTKEPLTDDQWIDIINSSLRLDNIGKYRWIRHQSMTNESIGEHQTIVRWLRWTGMHISVLSQPEEKNLRVEGNFIQWKRPKKGGRFANSRVPIHNELIVSPKHFIRDLKKRSKDNSKQYFINLIKRVGINADIPELSQMSFRHTLGVWMLKEGYSVRCVMQTLNCSRQSLESYGKYGDFHLDDEYKRKGWL